MFNAITVALVIVYLLIFGGDLVGAVNVPITGRNTILLATLALATLQLLCIKIYRMLGASTTNVMERVHFYRRQTWR